MRLHADQRRGCRAAQVQLVRRLLIWAVGAALGVAATLLTSFGLVPAVVILAVAVLVMARNDALAGLAGLLVGFGGSWTGFLGLRLTSGAVLENDAFWLAVGVVPLAAGAVLSAVALGRSMRR
jgi:hypothetical protein